MQLPFGLHFLKKVELFQILRKLDVLFEKQLFNNGELPLWQAEKKILYWTYLHHKHLGSPLLIDDLCSKKSFILRKIRQDDAESMKQQATIRSLDANLVEVDFENVIKNNSLPMNTWYISGDLAKIGSKKKDFGFTARELETLQIRKLFGNLVSRNYATFYPESTDVHDDWQPDEQCSYMSREVTKAVVTTQENHEGIIITDEGLLMGEVISSLYYLRNIQAEKSSTDGNYQLYSGAENFLFKRKFKWMFYQFLIMTSYFALALIIFLIFKEIFYNARWFVQSIVGWYKIVRV